MDWRKIVTEVPEYQSFLTVAELDASTDTLAAEYPDVVNVETVGHSAKNLPIKLIKIGNW